MARALTSLNYKQNVALTYSTNTVNSLCLRAGQFVRFWACGEAFEGVKFPQMGDSLPWTPMNRRAKLDATSFIVGGEIRNRTNTHTHTN